MNNSQCPTWWGNIPQIWNPKQASNASKGGKHNTRRKKSTSSANSSQVYLMWSTKSVNVRRTRIGNAKEIAQGTLHETKAPVKTWEKKDNAPCCKHDGTYKWKDYPNIWQCKSNASNGDKLSYGNVWNTIRQWGQVISTKSATHRINSTWVIRFEFNGNKSMQSPRSSCIKVMDIFMQNTSKGSLCLITIITLIDTTCQVHLDKCCTDRGLISWDLAMILGHPISKSDARTSQLQQGHSQPINFCTWPMPCSHASLPIECFCLNSWWCQNHSHLSSIMA